MFIPLIIKQSLLLAGYPQLILIYKIFLFAQKKVEKFVRHLLRPRIIKLLRLIIRELNTRIMAHLSHDKGLLKAFAEGLDIHRATAAEVLSIPLKSVTDEQRRSAKAINFGLIYGMSAYGLSRTLGITPGLAKEYMDLYFHRYPKVKKYMENTLNLAHQQGYVETYSGGVIFT